MSDISSYLEDELPFLAWLDEYLDRDEVKTIFDVGACEAEDSIKMQRVYPGAKIYAFEPLSSNVLHCKKHINAYKGNRIELHEVALSDRNGQSTFYVSSGSPNDVTDTEAWDYGNKSSSLLKPAKTKKVHKWLKFENEEIVKTQRIDSFTNKNKIVEIDLLYMDVQGAELMVLNGAGNFIKNIKCIWLEVEAIELYKGQPLNNDIDKFMLNNGFVCVMDSVDDVSGDRLYVSYKLIEKIKKKSIQNPKAYAQKITTILDYINNQWESDKTPHYLKKLFEQRVVELHEKYNGLDIHRPLVSIVMSVYNSELHLYQAIKSILSQTFQDFEFLIINDGSTDKSLNIIKSFKDNRIRIISQFNHGLVYSLNKGISLARADYIARMDADDISLPSRLEKEVVWITSNKNRGLVSTYFALIDYKSSVPIGTTIAFSINHKDLRRTMYSTNPFAHGACMYRKDAITKLGLYSDEYGPTEDFELWRRIAKKWEVGLIPEVLFWYRINNPESVSQKGADIQARFVQNIIEEQWREPFVKKSIREIRGDLKNIPLTIPEQYRKLVESQYKDQQFTLTRELLKRKRLKQAFVMMCSLLTLRMFGHVITIVRQLFREFTSNIKQRIFE